MKAWIAALKPGVVGRYLAWDFALASGAVLLVLASVWITADSLLHLDDFAQLGAVALRNSLLRSLDILPQGVPTACAIGAALSLSRATRFREITAIRCGGIQLRVALVPLLAVTVLIALALGLLHDRALVPAHLALEGLAERDQEDRPTPAAGRWWYVSGDWIFSAAEFDPTLKVLTGVTAFELDERRSIERRLDSERALYLGKGQWEFFKVVDRRFGADASIAIQRFDKLALRLGVDLAPSLLRTSTGRAAHEAMTLHRLVDSVEEAANPAERATLLTAYHGRIALPIATLALVLLSIPGAIREGRRDDSLSGALLHVLVAVAGFWIAWSVVLVEPLSPHVHAAIPVWTTIAAALALGAWRFRSISE
jgi:lipopolysaccharide export LptBFGC system permease protein LptF